MTTALQANQTQANANKPAKAKRRQDPHSKSPKYRKRPRRSASVAANTPSQTDQSSASSEASEQADSDPDFDTRSNAPSVSSEEGSDGEVESDGILGDASSRLKSKRSGITVLYHGPSTEELAAASARAKPPSGKLAGFNSP